MNQNTTKPNLTAWGNPGDAKVVIHLRKDVYDAIYSHGRANPDREVGGILLGNVSEDTTGRHQVDIVGLVRAESAPGGQAQLQFTGAAWAQLIASARRHYPNQKVVGWYHTHPGFGAFLSDDDIASHRVAFSNPWHVAAVCDPIRDEFCFFGWDKSEIKAIKGFYTYEAPTEGPVPLRRGEKAAASQARRLPLVIAGGFVALLLALLVAILIPLSSPSRPPTLEPGTVVGSFSNQQGNEIYRYYFQENGEVWRETLELKTRKPAKSSWNREEDLPRPLSQMEVGTHRDGDGEGRIGTLEVNGQDEQKNSWLLSAGILETGGLVWQEPEPGEAAPGEAAPSLSVSPDLLDFGADKDTGYFDIDITGGPLTWELSADKPWLAVEPAKDDKTTQVTVRVDRSRIDPGQHTGVITVDWEGGPEAVDVRVTVPEEPKGAEFHVQWIEDDDRSGKIASRGETVRVHVSNRGEAEGDVQLEAEFDDHTFVITSWPQMQCLLEPEGEHTFELLVDPANVGDTATLTCRVKNLQRDNKVDHELTKRFGVE